MKGWVGLVGWLVADGLPTLVVTHQLQAERRTEKVRRPETDVLQLCHATNHTGEPGKNSYIDWDAICRAKACGPEEPCIRWDPDQPWDGALLCKNMSCSTVKYRNCTNGKVGLCRWCGFLRSYFRHWLLSLQLLRQDAVRKYLASDNEWNKSTMVSDKFTELLFCLEWCQWSKLQSEIATSEHIHFISCQKLSSISSILDSPKKN